MRERDPGVHHIHERIDWTQAHDAAQVLKRQLRFAVAVSDEARAVRCLRQVGIEGERSIDESGGPTDVAKDAKARIPSAGERDRVILAKLDGPINQPRSFHDFLLAIDHPAIHLALRVAERRHAIGRGNFGVMRGIVADNKPHTLEGLQLQEHLFARAVQLDPKNSDALARLARAILIQSSQAYVPAQFKEDALKRGAEAAEKALALDPGNPRAHLAMTYLHVLRGDFERGVLASERAIALDRNLAMAHNMLATSLLHLGKGSEAIPEAETAVRLDPIGPQIDVFRTTMGLVRLLLGQIDEAIDCFTRSRAGNPKLARAHAGAAIALAIKGDVPGAQVAAADLLRLAPDFRLSQTIDACLPTSPPRYRQFFEEVLRPGAVLAGVPV